VASIFSKPEIIHRHYIFHGEFAVNKAGEVRLKVSGVCGVLGPIIGFVCVIFAVASYSQFNWFNNALSDLGVVEGMTTVLFNFGLIVSGVLTFVFGLGLFALLHRRVLGVSGALTFVLCACALTLIGIFSENARPMHYYSSVVFFALFPISMFVICAEFLSSSRQKMGLFTFVAAAFAAIVWAVQFAVRPFQGVAIAETLSALAASVWVVVLGFTMFREASQFNP
jgi:hypothetical membrane protein